MEYLIEDGIIEDYTYTPYQKIGMKIDGYNLMRIEILNLFICDFEDDYKLKYIK